MTAVEYLVSCITKLEWDLLEKKIDCEEYGRIYRQNIQQAKEMEKQQTEISDEEINKYAWERYSRPIYRIAFKFGAKWYREQLKNKQ